MSVRYTQLKKQRNKVQTCTKLEKEVMRNYVKKYPIKGNRCENYPS